MVRAAGLGILHGATGIAENDIEEERADRQ
jgi:hypothetical protein